MNYTSGIFDDKTDNLEIEHEISVVGYGVENGTKFWVIRNSWGSHWGEQGFFKLIRGINNIAIETDCAWAVPKDTWTVPTLHQTTEEEKNDPRNANYSINGPYPGSSSEENFLEVNGGCRRVAKTQISMGNEKRPQLMSWDMVDAATLPANWDWRNVNNTNFLSWSLNQHIPQYCGSCWAHGTTSALADRFNILLGDQNPTPVGLNPQVMVNCEAGGDCNGGDPSGVYYYAYHTGIPDSSCMNYVAKNLDSYTCDPIDVCRDCTWPPPPQGESGIESCWAVTNYRRYYVSNYYSFSGASNMKTELFKNGPISCGIMVTDGLQAYKSGIYSEYNWWPMINHEISVVGWGLDEATQTEFWIVRNSWGTYWGERSFFRIKMHSDNLAIETDCTAGIPAFRSSAMDQPILVSQ